ncbi:MAG: extensin family protein [Pseudomonadota bacterium]
MKRFLLILSIILLLSAALSQMTGMPLPSRNPEKIKIQSRVPEIPSVILPTRNPNRVQTVDAWSIEQIADAKNACTHILKDIPVVYDFIPPVKKGVCGNPSPILVHTIGDNPAVNVSPPARMNCEMAAKLTHWMQHHVQPLSNKLLNTKIIGMRNIASYACRRRYGNPKKKMSEHAFFNAIDIAGFITADERRISLLRDWGPTRREILSEKLRKQFALALSAKVKAFEANKAKWKTSHPVKVTKGTPHTATKNEKAKLQTVKSIPPYPYYKTAQSSENHQAFLKPARIQEISVQNVFPLPIPKSKYVSLQRNLGRRNFPQMAEDPTGRPKNEDISVFLRKIHQKACGIFHTVLGPESNDAHKNHFHFDLAKRKYKAYCE